jgi:hypothetical protein
MKPPTTSLGEYSGQQNILQTKGEGSRQYLVDDIVGIDPHDRVSADVVINAIDEV